MLYDSLDEAVNRLVNTMVTYDGAPVYVTHVERHGKDFQLSLSRFPYDGRDQFNALASDPLFKGFQSPPLGYCNFFYRRADTTWCERIPSRQRRQGLSGDTCNAVSLVSGLRIPWNELYISDGFNEMVRGEYPSFDEAFQRLIPSSSIAVARDFAVRMSEGGYTFLYYKRDEVGMFVRDNLYLRSDRQYLSEMIIEHNNLPNRVEVM
jgi:hypothetical protein